MRFISGFCVLVASVLFMSVPVGAAAAEAKFVALPVLKNQTVAPRIVYIENPRFPKVSGEELVAIVRAAAVLVNDHFGVTVSVPTHIPVRNIDDVFRKMVGNEPEGLTDLIGDFRNGKVDWDVVKGNLSEEIESQKDPLSQQIDFARPYLINPPKKNDVASFAQAVVDTFKHRLSQWTVAQLKDGHPVIGKVPGRPDLPLNEYGYWTLMAKQGIDADIVLTNQLVASVEYIPVPVHTSIRGGITGGATEYNPASQFGASVWVSLFPYLSDQPLISALRKGETYPREKALTYAGAMLAHEMGHQLFQLGHPWSNPACVMRPAEILDFAAWVKKFNAKDCQINSTPAMEPGTAKAPIW